MRRRTLRRAYDSAQTSVGLPATLPDRTLTSRDDAEVQIAEVYLGNRLGLGKRIVENVSREAWKQWLEHQKMLVNEEQLNQ